MDEGQKNERTTEIHKDSFWRWRYIHFLSALIKQKENSLSKEATCIHDKEKKVVSTDHHLLNSNETKNLEVSYRQPNLENVVNLSDNHENGNSPDSVPREEIPTDSQGTPKSESENQNKPKKGKAFKNTFSGKEDRVVDGFLWLEDENENRNQETKYKWRRYFLKNPDYATTKTNEEDLNAPDGKPKENAMKHGIIDFVAGSLAGVVQVYASQPLDTVKVKLQTFPKLYGNMFQCLMKTYSKDGIYHGLYAGTVPAVVASVTENSVLFAAYGCCQSAVAALVDTDNVQELSVLGNACAGSLAACFSTLTLCPTELVKCKLQAIQEIKPYVAKGSKVAAITPFQLTKQIYHNEGIAGFYRGLSSTFAREIPGFFFFFGSYEATRQYFTREGESKDDIGALKTMIAGSVGGIALWTSTFPADVIKSRIQIQNLKSSMLSVAIDIVRKEGVLALYNGLLPSILRAIPATATLFLVYEHTKKIMNDIL